MTTFSKEGLRRSIWGSVLIGILITAILVAGLVRLFFGVELTDEAYYVTMAARFTLGNLPFYDNWDLHQTSALLYFPLVSTYKAIHGDFSGIMLFMRLMMFCFNLSISVIIYLLLRKELGLKSLIIALPLVVFAPFSIYTFSYNTLHYTLAMVGCCLVFGAITSRSHKRTIFLAMAGAVHAFTLVAYPSAIVLLGINSLIVFMLFYSENPKSTKAGIRATIVYTLSGCTIVAAIAMFLVLHTGLVKLGNGFNGYLSSAEEIYRAISPNFRLIKISQLLLWPLDPFFLHKIIVLFAWNALLFQQFKEDKTNFLLILMAGYLLFILYVASRVYEGVANGGNMYILSEFTAFSAMIAPVLILYTKQNKSLYKLLLIVIGIPSLIVWLESFWVSMARLSVAAYLLIALSLLTPVFIVLLFQEYWKPITLSFNRWKAFNLEVNKNLVSSLLIVVFVSVISGLFLFAFYGHVYRDGVVWSLTKRIGSGVYEGLYTQPKRGSAIELLDKEMRKFDDPLKTVLVLDHMPFAYMSTGMKPCAPYNLDISFSRFNQYLSGPIFRYFKFTEQLPDKIFCIGEEGKACLDNPNYEFADYIRSNYVEIYNNYEKLYGLRVLRKK